MSKAADVFHWPSVLIEMLIKAKAKKALWPYQVGMTLSLNVITTL